MRLTFFTYSDVIKERNTMLAKWVSDQVEKSPENGDELKKDLLILFNGLEDRELESLILTKLQANRKIKDISEVKKAISYFYEVAHDWLYGATMKDKIRGNKRTIKNDNLGEDFYSFLLASCTNFVSICKGAIYICMSSSELDVLQKAFREAGGHWSTFIVWAKNTFTIGRSDYQRQYEPILYGWAEGSKHFWCGDRSQGDVWNFNKPKVNDLHPTMKPVELVQKAIENSSKSRDIVLDCFGGSGSTLIACEKAGRYCYMIELDPKYCDVIIKRWQDFTGKDAINQLTSKSFKEHLSVSMAIEPAHTSLQ